MYLIIYITFQIPIAVYFFSTCDQFTLVHQIYYNLVNYLEKSELIQLLSDRKHFLVSEKINSSLTQTIGKVKWYIIFRLCLDLVSIQKLISASSKFLLFWIHSCCNHFLIGMTSPISIPLSLHLVQLIFVAFFVNGQSYSFLCWVTHFGD